LLESIRNFQIPPILVRFLPVWLESSPPESSHCHYIPAIGYQNLRIFGGRVGVPTNSNAWLVTDSHKHACKNKEIKSKK